MSPNNSTPPVTTGIVIDIGGGDDHVTAGIGISSLGSRQILLPVTLLGGSGNDTLFDSADSDSLVGGSGDDIIDQTTTLFSADTISGGADTDTMRFSLPGEAGSRHNIDLPGGTITSFGSGAGGVEQISGVERIQMYASGSPTDPNLKDTITGTSANETILAGAGADRVDAGGGDDVIFGANGNDTINGSSGSDSIYGEQDTDFLQGGSLNDTVLGEGGNNDVLFGSDGNDFLSDRYGTNNTLSGGAGIDNFLSLDLEGVTDNDQLFGGLDGLTDTFSKDPDDDFFQEVTF